VDPTVSAVLRSWPFDPALVLVLFGVCVIYLRGFRAVRRQLPAHFPAWRRAAFLAGLTALLVALASPLDAFADLLLQVHMIQHWLLMMVAPPLLWLGAPAVPLMRGLPRRWLREGAGPFLAWPSLHGLLAKITRPWFAATAWILTTTAWHWPPAYQLALRSPFWHDLEHATFLATALLFWHAVILPWPSRRSGSRWPGVMLVGCGALFNTLFSATFAFSTRVFYPRYEDGVSLWGVAPLADQNAAGGLLWVLTSLPMLAAAVTLVVAELEPPRQRPRAHRDLRAGERGSGRGQRLQSLVRSAALRRALQWTLLALAAAIVIDGLFGPQRPSAQNLAGVLPWTYWRGWLVIGLLVLGNVFCAVCPFTLSRRLAARWLGRPFGWPRWLPGKWPAVALFATYLWAYEAFSLWNSPWWTAWIVIGYFAACFLIEGLFPRGRFCRHLCPIGQFQFVHSGASPLEVSSLDSDTCSRCRTHDCLRGNADRPGCPTGLFLPVKSGNADCTFCLDCVRACPHDNAGLIPHAPGSTLGHGRSTRPDPNRGLDETCMVLLLCFGAFLNAGAMTAPVAGRLHAALGGMSPAAASLWLALGWALALFALPTLTAWLCARVSRAGAAGGASTTAIAARFAPALVPLGLAMWTAHLGFHLLSGIGSLGPAAARSLPTLGLDALAKTLGQATASAPSHDGLMGTQIAVLGIGWLVSTAVTWRFATTPWSGGASSAARLAAPWVALCALLYLLGVWIVLQPMEMRGMLAT